MPLLAAVVVSLANAACGAFEESAPHSTPAPPVQLNLLQNGGFEQGAEPWTFREKPEWQPFTVSDRLAHGGLRSMKLELRGDESLERTRIAGALQAVQADQFPEFLSGYYRVEAWEPGAPFQYLQFVVIVSGSDLETGFAGDQVRFPIAGIERAPFMLNNARFRFLSRSAPAMREWTYFAYPVRQAFEQQYGRAPARWDAIEVFFEVRYDGKSTGTNSAAEVYYDDLYLGPQALNPNRPRD